MRAILKLIVSVLLIVSALIIVPPRVWVKNKKAKLTYNGHISEKFKLFHGSDGRVLFYLGDDPDGVYVYTQTGFVSQQGLWRCDNGTFIQLKLVAFSVWRPSGCDEPKIGQRIHPVVAESQSIQFALHDVPVVVSWQAAPR